MITKKKVMIVMTLLLIIWAFYSFYQPLIRIAFIMFGIAVITYLMTPGASRESIKRLNLLSKSVIVIYVSVALFCTALIFSYQERHIESPDYIIILGDWINGEQPGDRLSLRLEAGINQYNQYKSNSELKIIVTGGMGKGEQIPEAVAMQRYLVSKGISASSILVEKNATSTRENLALSKSLIEREWQQSEAPRVLIVSSWFHLFRTHLLAEYYHYDYGTVSAKTPKANGVQPIVREWFAIINDLIFTWMK